MPRSMWRGAISFGMVAIPVRMYVATESKSVSFRLLCPNDHTPIKNKRWCETEQKEVGWNEVVRGYEVAKDEYVVIEDKDLDDLPLPSQHTIDILEFVPDAEINAGVYIKGAYYLEPESVGVKPYYLLKKALEESGKVAIGKVALRDREHLCRLTMYDNGILLNTLHWPDEIRDTKELSFPEEKVEIKKQELAMARMLIENLSAASFEPERFADEYRAAVEEVVAAKVENREVERPAEVEPPKVADLMAALKASVEASKAQRASQGEGRRAAAGGSSDGQAQGRSSGSRSRKSGETATAARRRKAS